MYAKIENGKIVDGPRSLPRCTKSISGFDLQGDADLKKHGWLPVVDLPASYNEATQKIGGYSTKIEADRVIRTPIIEPLSTTELVELKKAELKADADAELEAQAIAAVGG